MRTMLQETRGTKGTENVYGIPYDVVDVIFTHVTHPSTYKEILHTNAYFHDKHVPKKDKYCNQLWTFVARHPELCIQTDNNSNAKNTDEAPTSSGTQASQNTLTTLYCSNSHISYWSQILSNPNTTLKILELDAGVSAEAIMFYWSYLATNPNITIEFINKYPPPFPSEENMSGKGMNALFDQRRKVVVWEHLSMHKNITIKDIDSNPSYPWRWEWVLNNPNVTYHDIEIRFADDRAFMETAKSHYDTVSEMNKLAENIRTIKPMRGYNLLPSITVNDLILNPGRVGDVTEGEWSLLSDDKNLTADFIEKYIDKPWRWDIVFSNTFGV
jgi:hypothetical protein